MPTESGDDTRAEAEGGDNDAIEDMRDRFADDVARDTLDDPLLLPDNDSPWKELIASAFPDFMAFFQPGAAREIDWARTPERLDVELQKIAVHGDVGRRYADQLMKVWLLSGEEQWVLVHVEVQGTRDAGFPRRMFEYRTRIYHRYQRDVASIAILADDTPGWRPRSFTTGRWGSSTSCTFTTVKLLDYAPREQELLDSGNACGIAVVAHLRARASRKQWPLRLRFKLELTALLAEGGIPPDRVRLILSFIDWLLLMPRSWEARYTEEVRKIEESKRMPYVMSFERRAMEEGLVRGREQGRQEGRQEGIGEGREEGRKVTALKMVLRLVARRFGEVPEAQRSAIGHLPVEVLEELAEATLELGSVDELKVWVEERLQQGQ